MEINCVYMLILSYFSCQSKTSDSDIYHYSTGSISKKNLQCIQNISKPHFWPPSFLAAIFPIVSLSRSPASTIRATRSDRRWEGLEKRTLAMARKATGLGRQFWSTLAGFFHGNTCGLSNIWKYPLYLLWIFIWIWKYPLYLVLLENTNLFGNEVNEDSLENVCRCRIIHCWSKNA